MNRLKEYVEEPPEEQARCGDYWVVYRRSFVVYVSPETAAEVARRIEGWRTPRWITFLDIVGARVRVRDRDVDAICESTGLQRERERSFQRARQQEDQAERRSWEDYD
jgi:hypothetical protein